MNANGTRSIWMATGVIAVMLLATTHAQQSRPLEDLRANSLTILGGKGGEKIFLGKKGPGERLEIEMTDTNGVRRLQFALEPENGAPSLVMYDEEGRFAIDLGLDFGKGAHLAMGKNGNFGLASMRVDTVNGAARGAITLTDAENRQLFSQPEER